MGSDKPKDRGMAIALSVAGCLIPGLHKFYLGSWTWGWSYLLPGLMFWDAPTGLVPRVACLIEGVWFLLQGQAEFDHRFNGGSPHDTDGLVPSDPSRVAAIAQSLRQLEQLRQEGLITEYEFEQQRRQLLL